MDPFVVFERRTEPLATIGEFRTRVFRSFLYSTGTILGALLVGVAGYHYIAGFTWLDALLNAAMILGGMGPVGQLTSDGAKVFASLYALFSGLVFVVAVSIFVSPLLHRLLHRLHLDDSDI
jgi:hypothetical protein